MKGALKCLPDPNHWTTALPLVLLGIRTTIEQDLKCIAAQMVYGTTLHLPGEFVTSTTNNMDPISFATQLKTFMQQIKPPPVQRQQQRTSYVSDDLFNCTFVFVRHDGVKQSLQKTYDGPFRVTDRSDKHFTLDISGWKKVVSLDRLKPAVIDDDLPASTASVTVPPSSDVPPPPQSVVTPPPLSIQPHTTRSGRHVHWPKWLADYYMFN